MSGVGPAARPAPAMTSPGQASTWISLKPRPAAKQTMEARMWRHTPAQWRKSHQLERWPVAEQLTQTKRITAGVTGGPASGPAMDAIATTSSRVQTTGTDPDVTSCIVCQCQVVGQKASTSIVSYMGRLNPASLCTKKMKIVQQDTYVPCAYMSCLQLARE